MSECYKAWPTWFPKRRRLGRGRAVGYAMRPGSTALFFFLGLLFGRGEALEAFQQLFLGHAIDRDLGVVGIDGAAGGVDQRRGLGLGLVDLHIFLQRVDQLFLKVVGRDG